MQRERLRNSHEIHSDAPRASHMDGQPSQESQALEENVDAIKGWEQAALHNRSRAERLSDWITRTAASGPGVFFHVGWFTCWVLANKRLIPGITPFDPFPSRS